MQKEEWKDGKQEILNEDETVNQASALWTRSKNEISEEQYQEFYKHVGHDFDDPLAWTHARVEGRQEYTQLLYIPAMPRSTFYDRNARHGIKLYVRRVFIMDDAEQLMPQYMRFVRGVVDSSDLRSMCRARSCRNRKTSKPSARAAPARCWACWLTWPRTTRRNTPGSGASSVRC